MPKVSVIVLAYNVGEYIQKCLDAFSNQTLTDIEIIIVNNGSTDETSSIVNDYVKQDKRISQIHLTSESSPGRARNIGLDAAQGEYVMFPDGDDWVDLNYLETQVEALEANAAQISNSNMTVMYQDGCTSPKEKVYYPRPYVISGDLALKIMAYEFSCEINVTASASNKLYLRSFLVENKIRFLEGVFYEDQAFSYETLLRAKRVVCVPGSSYRYLKRIGSITQSYSEKHAEDIVRVYRYIKDMIDQEDQYNRYRACYFRSLEHCFNLIIRQIFECIHSEEGRKHFIRHAAAVFKEILVAEDYLEFCSSEEIRRHLQPLVIDTAVN